MIKKAIRFIKGAYFEWNYPNALKVWLNPRRVIVYYGYLGDYNYGDIMVFQAAEKLLGPGAIIVPIKRNMPPLVRWAAGSIKGADRKLVIGGGTLMGTVWEESFFEDFITEADVRILLHGTGSTSGVAIGFWRQVLAKTNFGGVRGDLSRKTIQEALGQSLNVFGDAAFGLYEDAFWNHTAKAPENSLLINMGTHHSFPGMENSRLVISETAKKAVENGHIVSFLPMHKADIYLAVNLQKSLPELRILPLPKTIEEAVNVFHSHSFAFGERLHFVVLALLAKCPFLSVNYRPKHQDMLDTVGMAHMGYNARELNFSLVDKIYKDSVANFDWKDCQQKIKAMQAKQISEYKSFYHES